MPTKSLKVWLPLATLVIQTLLVGTSFADEIIIPYGIKKDAFEKRMKKVGFDLSGKDRSIGFVKDEGGKATVYTYKTASPKLLAEIQRQSAFTARK